jgi:tetratricopeptide (TPR) repeat protein
MFKTLRILTLATISLTAVLNAIAQTPPVATNSAVASLLARAHAQEQTGRDDLAAQTWRQVLLVDPRNRDALAGLARSAKLAGNEAQANDYLNRLRQVDPNNSEITKIQATATSKVQAGQLQQAAQLAQAGHAEDALRLYRSVWGNKPPDGDWALAYYDTEASTEAGRPNAMAGLRALALKYPADTRYNITLGRILTYSPKSRAEGLRLLGQFPQDPAAQSAARQAQLWDAQNPNDAPEIRAYLAQHPDEQIAQSLAESEARHAKTGQADSGIARGPAERDAFAALAANRVDDAQEDFLALLAEDSNNPRAAAGLGFLRMKQNNFSAAITLLQQAQQGGLHRADIDDALKTSRFWATVQRGTEALNTNRTDEAVAAYKAALLLRPGSIEALNGLSGAYMKAGEPTPAIAVYRQMLHLQPNSADAWRGLFDAQVQSSQPAEALETARRLPPAVKAALQRNPEYLRSLAAAYTATGQPAMAQTTMHQALALPFPNDGRGLKAETRLQYAALLADDQRYAQAAGLYRDILNEDPESLPAWQGLIAMQHQAGHDPEAIATVERMSPATYDSALEDNGFLSLLASIYQQQNRFDIAQQLLQRAARGFAAKNQPVPIPMQLQLASICLQQNRPDQAYAIFRSVLTAHPERIEAWKGLIAALHQTHRDRDALAELRQIPADVRRQLDRDVENQQTVAAIYAATGNSAAALQLIAQIQAHYRALHGVTPSDVDIQNAWLLYNTHDDRDLYRALMALGGRDDLADDQRRVIQTIWATWSVRRSSEAVDAGNSRRSLQILSVAAQAFPGNHDVSKALAGGYLKAGDPKHAMEIFNSLDLTNASVSDYQNMVGAALALPNLRQAEVWLREALDKFVNDPQILALAARFEQARGDHNRAAGYWKASLAAMPPADPANRLAHTLDRPDALPGRSALGVNLSSLLNPDNDATSRNQPPSLPSYRDTYSTGQNAALAADPNTSAALYGPDPTLLGTAPVERNIPAGTEMNSPSDTSTPSPRGTPSRERLDDYVPASELQLPQTAAQQQATNLRAADDPEAFAPPDLLGKPRSEATAQATNPDNATEVPSKDQTAHTAPAARTPASRRTDAASTLPSAASPRQARHPEASVERIAEPNAAIHYLANSPSPQATATTPSNILYLQPQFAAEGDALLPQLGETSSANQAIPQTSLPQSSAVQSPQAPPDVQQLPGITDVQLTQQSLPPLRGPWSSLPVVHETDVRADTENQIAALDAGYSPWKGGTGYVNHRTGTPGFDQLTLLEAPFEASATIGGSARITALVIPSLLDSGVATGTATDQLGTLAATAIPAQQLSAGVGGELQLSTSDISLSAGTTPRGFLVPNITGRLSWHPVSGPLSFTLVRDGIQDSQLSYAGLRDPGSVSSTYAGDIWGGVVSTAGNVQYGRGDEKSGYYAGMGGQYITGLHVETNNRIDGVAGAYWKIFSAPNGGELTLGANFFGMHYAHNLRFFTYGQGGYFSPDVYFLASVPFTIKGQYGNNLHYVIAGGLGLQAFQEQSSLYFPTHVYAPVSTTPIPVKPLRFPGAPALHPVPPVPIVPVPVVFNNPSYPAQSVVGGNYDLHAEISDHVIDHWYVGAFISFNNTRDYASQSVGFFIRYMSRTQDVTTDPTTDTPTGMFPYKGTRPLLVP